MDILQNDVVLKTNYAEWDHFSKKKREDKYVAFAFQEIRRAQDILTRATRSIKLEDHGPDSYASFG